MESTKESTPCGVGFGHHHLEDEERPCNRRGTQPLHSFAPFIHLTANVQASQQTHSLMCTIHIMSAHVRQILT